MTTTKMNAGLTFLKTPALFMAVGAMLLAGCQTPAPPMPEGQAPVAAQASAVPAPSEIAPNKFVVYATDGSSKITIDTTEATNMTDWAEHKLAPVLAQWYPKISAMLPTPGYIPPTNWTVTLAPGNGVAATGGTRVTGNATWFKNELDKQGVGALLHEEVHVIQQYGGGRRNFVAGNFALGDITNFAAFVKKLKDKSDPVSTLLDGQLTPAERKAIAGYRGPGPKAYILRTNLVGALNRIISGPGLYDAAVFKGVTLRESTTNLLADKPEGSDLKRLNRSLLEDAYAGELARRAAGGGRRGGGGSNTGWLTEGIPDYIRWFIYEPQSHGADAVYMQGRFASGERRGQPFEPKYTDSYRISANFLNYVVNKYDRHLVTKLNDALRQGKYYDDIWADNTGKTVEELNQEWLVVLREEVKSIKPKVASATTPSKT